jgi:hypothetical protein
MQKAPLAKQTEALLQKLARDCPAKLASCAQRLHVQGVSACTMPMHAEPRPISMRPQPAQNCLEFSCHKLHKRSQHQFVLAILKDQEQSTPVHTLNTKSHTRWCIYRPFCRFHLSACLGRARNCCPRYTWSQVQLLQSEQLCHNSLPRLS